MPYLMTFHSSECIAIAQLTRPNSGINDIPRRAHGVVERLRFAGVY
jgi:hypothetical protein